MSRERSMQRMNALTLAAFLVGLAAFVFDSATPAPARITADVPAWTTASSVQFSGSAEMPAAFD